VHTQQHCTTLAPSSTAQHPAAHQQFTAAIEAAAAAQHCAQQHCTAPSITHHHTFLWTYQWF
jgi:hypothetical protein